MGVQAADVRRRADINPSEHGRSSGNSPQASAPRPSGDRGRTGRVSGLVAHRRRSSATTSSSASATRSWPARTRSAACSRARRARRCRGHRRDVARGADLPVLLRRVRCGWPARSWLRAARHRRRDHARAGRRGRPDHARGTSRSRFRPGRSRRRWPTAIRGAQAGRAGAGRPGRWPRSSHRAGLPGRVQPGHGPRLGGRRGHAASIPDVDAISFTGSVPTGRRVAAPASRRDPMKKVQLEMGGKNPLVVLDDADLKVAVECAVNGAFFSTGQRCTASSRLIVTEGIHDRFVEALTERMKGAGGRRCAEGRHRDRPGRRPEPARPGPALYRDRQGGGRQARLRRRALNAKRPASICRRPCSPTSSNKMRIAREEIFGPVAGVIRGQGL